MQNREDTTLRVYESTRDALTDVRRELSFYRNETLMSHDSTILALIDEWRKCLESVKGAGVVEGLASPNSD